MPYTCYQHIGIHCPILDELPPVFQEDKEGEACELAQHSGTLENAGLLPDLPIGPSGISHHPACTARA